MEEIKFRVWDKRYSEMRYDLTHIKFSDVETDGIKKGQILVTTLTPENTTSEGYGLGTRVLMQYTGFKDKGKEEIYEKDILGIKHIGGKIEAIGEVLFDPDFGMFVIRYTNGGWCELWKHLLEKNNEGKEIIGNSCENPELLNKQ